MQGFLVNVSLTQSRGLLGSYIKPQRTRIILLTLGLFASLSLQLLNPQIIRYFIDTTQHAGTMPGAQRGLLVAAAIFIALGLTQHAVALVTLYLSEMVGWNATNALRADLTRHCLDLDMSFHKQHTPGELIQRVDGDVTALANFFSQLVIRVVGNLLLIVAVLLLLFREDWRLGLGLTLYSLITLVILGSLQQLGVSQWAGERQAHAEMLGFLEERMGGMEDIRASGAERYVMGRLESIMTDLLRKSRVAQLVSNLTFVATNFLLVTGYALGLGLGAYLYLHGGISIGTAYLIVFYIGMLADPLQNIREQVQDVQQATASIQRIQALFHTSSQLEQAGQGRLPTGALAVTLDHVSFAYGEQPSSVEEPRDEAQEHAVLHAISLSLQPGKVLGLLGRTGSGKTTLTRLLFRLYDPSHGELRLATTDLRDVASAELQARVGMVTQDVQLFAASIRDNLRFFNPRIGDDQIRRALAQLGLEQWVDALPAGLDTMLAGGGQGLSAGEAQLLAFTRVLLKDPGLVILDEASSRLDPVTEHLLEQAINNLLAGRTGIIIAHRLRTVQRADEILILDRGQVAEYGPREALANDPHSRFYSLLQTGLEEALV
ncbi:MAG: ABC transporter ATP-binding protein [Herpetosiphonaceae bacterium]|nr:ABC transporter ATP-binding protein [Herpetosiphonaceae bacterium]